MTGTPHRWRFFRSGGFDQVRIETPADLRALRELDQKLWAALACPVKGLEFDARTLEYIDSDKDGRIRAPELLAAVDWTLSVLADANVLFDGEVLPLAALNNSEAGQHLQAAARRLLGNIGKADVHELSVADTEDRARVFPPDKPNGDGLVPATLCRDESLKLAIADIIATVGSATDRSGEVAVSEEHIREFFRQATTVVSWHARLQQDAALRPLGDDSESAVATLAAVREKIDDYFNRVRMAAFDPRAAALMNGKEAELERLAEQSLADSAAATALPLANIIAGRELPLDEGLNPAWQGAMQAFRQAVLLPLLGEKSSLSARDWQQVCERCAAHLAWRAERPQLSVCALDTQRLQWLLDAGIEEKLLAEVAADKAVAAEAEGLLDVDKLVRFQRHLVTLLNNFIALRDFYTRTDKAVFQAGTLYIDGKSCDLTVRINDVAKHSAMAGASGSYLAYCECSRPGSAEKMHIVAAVTAGDAGKLMLGRNGIFYDRKGVDWDAQVVKLIEHPISVREAFWTPYRRMSKMVSAQMQKMAAARDKAIEEKSASGVAASASHIQAAPAAGAAAAPPAATPPFDIAKFAGIFAAIGLAIGAIGTALAAVAAGFLALKWWQMPLAVLGLMLLISGPSMLMAWFKLRKRNLAPILDANGWAVNTEARINIPFGTALTQLALLPHGAERSLTDPYAHKNRGLVLTLLLLALAAVVALCWWLRMA